MNATNATKVHWQGARIDLSEAPEKVQKRFFHFAPNGIPKKVKIYDNGGETCDRYTACYTGTRTGSFGVRGMSSAPFHPQGVGMWSEYPQRVDHPKYSHLGKPAKWENLPADVRFCIWQDYAGLWEIPCPIRKG